MAWGMIGGAAVSVVGGALLGGSNKSAVQQQAANPSAGNAANNPAMMADPYASQRYQFQPMLKQFTTDPSNMNGDAGAQHLMNFYASGGNAQPMFSKAEEMLQPGYQFTPTDPSYQFRLDQGSQNIERNAAATGALGSGNVLAALQDYGQHTASQEFQNEFQRRMAGATGQAGEDSSLFGQANQVNQNSSQAYNQRFNQLALLSGALTGSPTAASSQLATQQAGSAAQLDKYGNLVGKAGTALWNYATGDGGSTGTSSDAGAAASTPDYYSQMFPTLGSGGNFTSPLNSGIGW